MSSAREAAGTAHRIVDEALEVVLPTVNPPSTIACKSGCNACCIGFVRATKTEAARIAEWLLEPSHADALSGFEARLPEWANSVAGAWRPLEVLLARHGGQPTIKPGVDNSDVLAYALAARTYLDRRAMCPFNDGEGRCTIYEVRPLPCRAHYVLDTAAQCTPALGGAPNILRDERLTAALVEARGALATADPAPDRALPILVAEALDAARA